MFDPDDLVIIGLDTEDGDKHPLWDPRIKLPVDEALARNIRVRGVLLSIRVRKNGDRYEVVDGRQRVQSARLAKKWQVAAGEVEVRVPAMVSRGEDADMFGVSVAANELRRGDTPMARARKAQRYLDMGASEEEVCNAFGVRPMTLQAWTTLLDLAPQVRKAVDAGELSASAAATLAGQSNEQQVEHLDQLRAEGVRPTVGALEGKVRSSQGRTPVVTPRQRIDAAVAHLAEACVDPAAYADPDVLLSLLRDLASDLGRSDELQVLVAARSGEVNK